MQIKRNCPNCDVEMRHVTTKSHYDVPILLDQCEICGGIWVDGQELYKIDYDETPQLKELDDEIFRNIKKEVVFKKDLHCPIDNALLIQPKKTFFPDDSGIVVEMCPTCHSVWFNYGELAKHQAYRDKVSHQKEKEKTAEETETIKNVKKLLEKERSKTPEIMRRLGSFFSTPVRGGAPGSMRGLLPILLSTLHDAVEQQKLESSSTYSPYNSDKIPESIIPAIEKNLQIPITKQSLADAAIQKIREEYQRGRRAKKAIIVSILLYILFSLFLGLINYRKEQKEEKMRDFFHCITICPRDTGQLIDGQIVKDDKIEQESIKCNGACFEKYKVTASEAMEGIRKNEQFPF